MKQSLSIRSKRILNIINHLITHEGGCLVSDLASLNECTVQTIYNDIKYVKEHFIDIITFESLGNTLRMTNYNLVSLLRIKQAFLLESVSLNIIISAFLFDDTTILSLSQELNYSEVHIRTKIKEINHVYEEYGISLFITKNQTIRIQPLNNYYMISFIDHIFSLTQRNIHEYIDAKTKQDIRERVSEYELTPEIDKYLSNYMATYHYFYGEHESFHDYFKELVMSDKIQNSGSMCVRSLNNYKGYSIDPEILQSLNKSIYVLIGLTMLIPKVIDDFLNRFEIFFNLYELDNKDFCDKFNEMLVSVEKNNDINLQKVKYFLIYHLFIHSEKIDLRRKIKIAVFSDLGINHAKVLTSKIQPRFMEHTVYALDNLNDLSDYDIICTTSIINSVEEKRIVSINDYLTSSDMVKIFERISYIHSLEKAESSVNIFI